MGIFNKILSTITYPGKVVVGTGGKMKRWLFSRTIGTALAGLAAAGVAALLGDLEFQQLIKDVAPWAYPIVMIILRLVTSKKLTK